MFCLEKSYKRRRKGTRGAGPQRRKTRGAAHEEEMVQEETLSENQQRILQLLEKEGKRSWTNIRTTLSKQKVSYSKHPLREDLENLVRDGFLLYEVKNSSDPLFGKSS